MATPAPPPPAPAGWTPKPAPPPVPKGLKATAAEIAAIAARKEALADGALIGAGGKVYPPNTSLASVTPVLPDNKATAKQGLGIYINGIRNDIAYHEKSLHALADVSGLPMVGIHNSTNGMVRDALEVAAEKLGVGSIDKSRVTLTRALQEVLARGEPVYLMAHSQGGLMVAGALDDLKAALKKSGMNKGQIEQAMQLIHVESFGSAATKWPDGPQYVHYINDADPIPRTLGTSEGNSRQTYVAVGLAIAGRLGSTEAVANVSASVHDAVSGYPGKGAVVRRFRDSGDPTETLSSHLLPTYLKHRVPFEEARDIKK